MEKTEVSRFRSRFGLCFEVGSGSGSGQYQTGSEILCVRENIGEISGRYCLSPEAQIIEENFLSKIAFYLQK